MNSYNMDSPCPYSCLESVICVCSSVSTEINSKVMPYARHITECSTSRELEIWLVMLVSIFHKQNTLLLRAHLKISQSLRQGSIRMCPCQQT